LLNPFVRRQGFPLLLEAFLVIEWVFLAPAGTLALMMLGAGIFLDTETLAPGFLAVVLVSVLGTINFFCWQLHSWALWLRAGLSFAIATALVPPAGQFPELWVLIAERSLQAGLAVWLAVRP